MSVSIVATVVLMLMAAAQASRAQGWQPPADSQRCPSKWGPQDQRGSGNHMKPDTVLRAARLIRAGEVFELGRVLSETMPMPAGRRFEILTKRTRRCGSFANTSARRSSRMSRSISAASMFTTWSRRRFRTRWPIDRQR